MKASLQSVFDKLVENGRKGVTFSDFPKGKDLRKRMSELRQMGYAVVDQFETLPSGCRRKRYFLLRIKRAA